MAEIDRRLDNLIRLGTIAEVDYKTATARVTAGGITTDFIPFLTFRAGTTKTWSAPSVGEQVLIISVSGEFNTGLILPAVYASNAPSSNPDEHLIVFPDGTEIMHNSATGHLSAKNCKTALIQASNSITADTPQVICTQNVVIKGNLTVDGTISSKGAISTQSSVTATGEVSGKGISLSSHTHSGVEPGNKRTGTP
ncbi:baseplate assembly protein [Pasteurellaceae bacterium LFhippo2]|nr:baseplate assembly protein [Pasteurellaceae bacterium LFhippo2]